MKLSYEWLSEWLDLSQITPEELGEKMSRTGIEVDSVTDLSKDLDKIVVGYTMEVKDHPDSDHLHMVTVDVNEEEPLQIVCGAPNIAKGQKVIVALHGARIAGGHKIKKGKLRGVVSQGMICSLEELGLSSSVTPKAYEDGIYVFEDPSIEVGMSAIEALALDSAVVELDLTANRADALSMRGAVHEIAAIYGLSHSLDADVFEKGGASSQTDMMSVNVENAEDTFAYHMMVIKNVKVQASPQWLQNRLMACGIRPINNIVDVTNYVLLEYGQPLHAFDYDKLENKRILVRRATQGETLITLDGIERELTDELIITDGHKPLALAGVMGGADTEITDSTTNVALEFALFHPRLIRKASQKHNLRSESSARFEKGINRATVVQAGKRAAQLIAELGEGTLCEEVASSHHYELEDVIVSIRLSRLNHVLGTELTKDVVLKIFNQLDFPAEWKEDTFFVHVPPHRYDISIEADLVEEVGRIYGYDLLPETLPICSSTQGGLTDKQRFVRWTRTLLQGAGLSQAYTYALTSPEKATWFTKESNDVVRLDLPMSEERSVLRQSMLASLLEAVQYNTARSQQDIRLFEVGRVFSQNDEGYHEKEMVAGIVTGNWTNKSWNASNEVVNFYHVKGMLEAYFEQIGCKDKVTYRPLQDISQLHPGQSAEILLEGEAIGVIGKIHPQLQKELSVKDTFVFELALLPLLAESLKQADIYAVPKYPGMSRDIALQVPVNVSHEQIKDLIMKHGGEYLVEIHLFDLYQGEHIAKGYKSLAYSLSFLNRERTLTDEEILQAMESITTALLSMEGVSIR